MMKAGRPQVINITTKSQDSLHEIPARNLCQTTQDVDVFVANE